MSIEKLENISEEFVDREDSRWMDHDDCLVIYKFMQETIATLKNQSDMITGLQQEFAKKKGKFISWDYGDDEWGAEIYGRYNKKGEIIIEDIEYFPKEEKKMNYEEWKKEHFERIRKEKEEKKMTMKFKMKHDKFKKLPYLDVKVVKVEKEKEDYWCGGLTLDGKQYKIMKKKNKIPYLKEFPKGWWVNGERIDKIKFPCFCSYVSNHMKWEGEINKSWKTGKGNTYYLSSLNGQKECSMVAENNMFENLIKSYDIHILKAKLILFEEE